MPTCLTLLGLIYLSTTLAMLSLICLTYHLAQLSLVELSNHLTLLGLESLHSNLSLTSHRLQPSHWRVGLTRWWLMVPLQFHIITWPPRQLSLCARLLVTHSCLVSVVILSTTSYLLSITPITIYNSLLRLVYPRLMSIPTILSSLHPLALHLTLLSMC